MISATNSNTSSMAAARLAERSSVIGYTNGTLRKGMESDAVRSLQQRLQSSGFDPGTIDGKFGNQTANALRDYQRSLGLQADGVAGRRTFDAMNGAKQPQRTSSVSAPVGGRVSTQLPNQGDGFDTYGPRSMQYGTPQTVQNVEAIASRYHARTGNTLEVGDISREHGGRTDRHRTHLNGTDVDIRPPSNHGGPTNWRSDGYDRQATRTLIEEIRRTNPNARILFNDPVLRREGLTSYANGHDNHLHVTFR
jgi:peptidoglycan hydrolase-like protein with peptidoglycan-binding domain